MKEAEHEQEKVLLTIASLTCGFFICALYLSQSLQAGFSIVKILVGLVLGLVVALGYACTGGLVVRIYCAMRSWAHQGEVLDLSQREKLRLAAFWPVTLVTSVVVYLFLGVINRYF